MNNYTQADWVFHQVEVKCPALHGPLTWASIERLEWRERVIHNAIVDALNAAGEMAALLKPGGAQSLIPPVDLGAAVTSRLVRGVFDPLVLRDWSGWHGATVLLPRAVAENAIRLALDNLQARNRAGGRPRKASWEAMVAEYAASFPKGHRAEGVSWNVAQRRCPSASSVHPDTFKRAVKSGA